MRHPIRLSGIVLLSVLPVSTSAQHILVVGVKEVSRCEFATDPLIRDLQTVPYPANWTIVVVCDQVAWEQTRRKADALQTNTAFTNLRNRITVINGDIYRAVLPLQGTHRNPRTILQHEAGHIICNCDNENTADVAAGIR